MASTYELEHTNTVRNRDLAGDTLGERPEGNHCLLHVEATHVPSFTTFSEIKGNLSCLGRERLRLKERERKEGKSAREKGREECERASK